MGEVRLGELQGPVMFQWSQAAGARHSLGSSSGYIGMESILGAIAILLNVFLDKTTMSQVLRSQRWAEIRLLPVDLTMTLEAIHVPPLTLMISPSPLPSQRYVCIGACLYICWMHVPVGFLFSWQWTGVKTGRVGNPFDISCLLFHSFQESWRAIFCCGH